MSELAASSNDQLETDALISTPGRKIKDGSCFSPYMYPTPQAPSTHTPLLNGHWGGEDASLLHDPFSRSTFGGVNPPATPGFLTISSGMHSDAPPSTTTKFINGNLNTPRVFFKDQLTETFDFQNSETTSTPFTSRMVTTPKRMKAVTVSGHDRLRGIPLDEERENLLSTAFLDTPKSAKSGSIQDMDQSLHHIDACIKSPLNFGSPNLKGSPLRQ
jgi:hypothetical protein